MNQDGNKSFPKTKSGPLRDGVVGLAATIILFGLAVALDAAERWFEFAKPYEEYELDELPIFLAILSVVMAWYGFRRWREMMLVSAVRRRLNQHLETLLARENLRARQFAEIEAMDEGMLAAEDSREACEVAVIHLRQIFPFGSGAFFLTRQGLETLIPVGGWGAFANSPPEELRVDECRGLRGGGYRSDADCDPLCKHCGYDGANGALCIPITGQGKTYGILQLLYGGPYGKLPQALASKVEFDQVCDLAGIVCRTIGQHLANISLRHRLYDESWRDPLTGLLNRRGLERFASAEMGRLAAEGECMTVLMMDVDGFKGVNDRYGHEVGDFVLEAVGRTILEQCRTRDIVCRLGGDEFLVVLPAAGVDVARARAEAIRQGVAELAASREDSVSLKVTMSVGIAAFPDDGADWEAVTAAADAALYAAKSAGKNRIAVSA